jgi:di/tricarboxylate transporter
MAMAVAARANINRFLMAIMVGNGAQAGSLSPFAPTGIIVNGIMDTVGLGGAEWYNYWTNAAAHTVLAFGGYFAFGGLVLFASRFEGTAEGPDASAFDSKHLFSLAVILAVVVAVLFLGANIGMAAFSGAVVLAATRMADHEQAIRNIPWTPIVMVTGVTVLIGLMQATGGLDLFTAALARFATEDTATGLLAFLTGVISVYSSTSGVVLPAFLPTIPGLIERLGGGDPMALAASMNIGAHLVDMSPLSTTGAICLAAVTTASEVRPTYNRLLIWGLSMSVVGGLLCFLVF